MASESDIPILDLNGIILEEGSEGWKEMSKKVREAFENNGCFLLRSDEIPNELFKGFFKGMKSLFELPEETKKKFYNPKPYRGFTTGTNIIPHSQTFGIDSKDDLVAAQNEFVDLMWPEGNPDFSEALGSMTSKAQKLSTIIFKMIVESFDLPKECNLDVEELGSTQDVRLFWYKIPQDQKDSEIALNPHSDKGTMALICENDVQGLQLLSENGNWVDVHIPTNGFVVLVGDILKAWSNGRFKAVTHRVVTRGDKERFSYVLFSVPKDSSIVKAPSELVDGEKHPQRYKPFEYGEFIHYQYTTQIRDPLPKFSAISS